MEITKHTEQIEADIARKKLICEVRYNEADLDLLRSAVEDLHYFEFVIDDIPVRGFIGHLEEGGFLPNNHTIYLWAHLHFNIEYNGEQIIYANVTTKEQLPIPLDGATTPLEVAFTYTVKWVASDLKYRYEDRRRRLKDNLFLPKNLEIHWLSIINSLVLVFLLIGFIIIIMKKKTSINCKAAEQMKQFVYHDVHEEFQTTKIPV